MTYDLRGSDREGQMNGAFTFAGRRPLELFRFAGHIGHLDGDFSRIENGRDSFLCINGQGQNACLRSPASAPPAIPLPAIFSLDDILRDLAGAPDGEIRDAGRENIAGRDARCVDAGAPAGRGRVCIEEATGLVLLIDGEFRGSRLTLRAKEVSTPVDRDFEPPYPVTEL